MSPVSLLPHLVYQIYNRRADSYEICYWEMVRKLVESLFV